MTLLIIKLSRIWFAFIIFLFFAVHAGSETCPQLKLKIEKLIKTDIKIITNPGIISDLKYNALTIRSYSSMIEELNKIINSNADKDREEEIASYGQGFMGSYIGKKAGAGNAKTIYSPFGGFDVQNAFWLSKSITDVISTGAEKFGSINDINKWLSDKNNLYAKKGANYDSYDSIRLYGELLYDAELEGLGNLAVSRIISFLKGRIKGIYFFDINVNGEIKLIPSEMINKDVAYKNAVIEFLDPADNILKRFWYISFFINEATTGNEPEFAFVNKLKFDLLLAKGIPDGLLKGKQKKWAVKLITPPAKRNNVMCVLDSRLHDRFIPLIGLFVDNRRSMLLKHFARPQTAYSSTHSFGYSYSSDYIEQNPIYIVHSKDLINP